MHEGSVDLVKDGDYLNLMFVDDYWYRRPEYTEAMKHRSIYDLARHKVPEYSPIDPATFFAGVNVKAQPYYLLVSAMAVSGQKFSIVDIGAHYGATTMDTVRLTRSLGISPAIFAFDAGKAGLLTKRNLENNGFRDVRCIQAAVGPIDGHAVMYFNEGHSEDNSLLPRRGVGTPVRVVKLDSILKDEGAFGPVCAKIDVQGAEPSVLMGMQDLIAAHPVAMFMEYTPHAIEQGNVDSIAFILSLMKTHHVFDTWPNAFGEVLPERAQEFRMDIAKRPYIWTDVLLVPKNMPMVERVLKRLRNG